MLQKRSTRHLYTHEADKSHNNIVLFIIVISLLLHGIFFLFLIQHTESFAPLHFIPEKNLEQPMQASMPEPTTPWAAHKASSYSAPVIFSHDDAPPTPTSETASEEEPQEEITENIPTPEQEPQKIDEAPQEPSQETSEPAPTEATNDITPDTTLSAQKIQPLKNTITHSSQHSYKRNPAPSLRQPTSSHKPFTLAQLAQGFLTYAEQERGAGFVEVRSEHQGMPSPEQLKHERYMQKIFWWIQKTYTIHGRPPNIATQNSWFMILNRDGSISTLHLMVPSSSPTLDRNVEEMIKEASSSFPPVPTFFKGQYPTRFTLIFNEY
jgi:outer membrane biosynthesis protein TonB